MVMNLFFHCQMILSLVEIKLCFELMIALLCMIIVKKCIIILGEIQTDGLDDSTLIAKAEYGINFSDRQNNFCWNLHYNGNSGYLFVNGVKTYQFKAKESKPKPYESCLDNIWKDFRVYNIKKDWVQWMRI